MNWNTIQEADIGHLPLWLPAAGKSVPAATCAAPAAVTEVASVWISTAKGAVQSQITLVGEVASTTAPPASVAKVAPQYLLCKSVAPQECEEPEIPM